MQHLISTPLRLFPKHGLITNPTAQKSGAIHKCCPVSIQKIICHFFTIMLQYQNSFRKSSKLCGLGVQINDSTLFVEGPFKSHSNNMYDDWSHFPLITDEICHKISCYVWKLCHVLRIIFFDQTHSLLLSLLKIRFQRI